MVVLAKAQAGRVRRADSGALQQPPVQMVRQKDANLYVSVSGEHRGIGGSVMRPDVPTEHVGGAIEPFAARRVAVEHLLQHGRVARVLAGEEKGQFHLYLPLAKETPAAHCGYEHVLEDLQRLVEVRSEERRVGKECSDL